jgi:hypothetical protein
MLLALLAAPALAFPLGKLIEPLATPGSQLWRWAGIAALAFLAAPLTGLLQAAVWAFAAPVTWPGRVVGVIVTVPTLIAAAASLGTLLFI